VMFNAATASGALRFMPGYTCREEWLGGAT